MRIIARNVKQGYGKMIKEARIEIVTKTPLQFGIGRMYGSFADLEESEDVDFFETVSAALEWLDKPAFLVENLHGKV